MSDFLVGLAGIVILGVGAQWISWRLHIPSILLLLMLGFIAGPVTGFIHPDEMFGEFLVPFVSISVAIILFEGGLSLDLRELPKAGNVIRNLITIGALVTWVLVALSAMFLLNFSLPMSLLFGAILVITGPTVVIPLLRHIRPSPRVNSILKWEGILNDPVGAILAVLVFEAILLSESYTSATTLLVFGILRSVIASLIVGAGLAGIMIIMLKRYWVPDSLHNSVSLMMVVTAFTASNILQDESGLLAVVIMGVILANQKTVNVKHIIEFKENLTVLLISTLFIVLAARLSITDLEYISFGSLAFLGILIFVIRPIAVKLSTLKSNITQEEEIFIAWMAPRGIVAAAITSVFALRLAEAGFAQAEQLVPITFIVIIGTVSIYSLTASTVANRLKVANPNPQGTLIIGAHSWARDIAKVLKDAKFKVMLVDTNPDNISKARLSGLDAYYANVLSEDDIADIDLDGIGHVLSLLPSDNINSLASIHFATVLGRTHVYQLPPDMKEDGKRHSKHLRGRILFGNTMTFSHLASRFSEGAVIKATNITEEFTPETFHKYYGGTAIPLFIIRKSGKLDVYTASNPPTTKPGQILISIVAPLEKEDSS